MKKLQFISILFIVLLSGCAIDEDVIPDETDPASAFVGTWSVSDNALKLNYEVTITKNPLNSTEVILSNFAGSGDAVAGLVTGKTVTIESQNVGSNWEVGGSGVYKSASRLEFTYNLIIGGDSEQRLAVFLK
jgi:hypothetical protein